jgi:hypothetical protein
MNIVKNLKNTKSDNQAKKANLLGANHKTVRYQGQTYTVCVVKLGGIILASAQMLVGKAPVINLFDKSTEAKDIKSLVEQGLAS